MIHKLSRLILLHITDTMTDNNSRYRSAARFTGFLTRIGCGRNERQRLSNDSFTTMESLVKSYAYKTSGFKSYLSTLNKTLANADNPVFFTPIIISRLLGTLYYFDQSANTFHQIPDIDYIDSTKADELAESYSHTTLDDSDEDDDNTIKIPKLDGSSNWRAFKDKMVLKLSTMKGARNIPLDYIIDSTPRISINRSTPYIINDDINVYDPDFTRMNSTHYGPYFKRDNKKVSILIKTLLINTPSYNHVITSCDKYDGKAAFKHLKEYYEGEDYKERNISTAFEQLNSTFYRGDTPRFTFEKFVSVHLEAHRLLFEAEYNNGLGMDDATKIQHLKNGIKADAGLEHALTTARTNRLAHGDFNAYVTFMSAEVDHRNKRRAQLGNRSRNISSLNRNDNRNRGNGRGRGRGHNRSNHNNLGPMLSATVDGKKIEGKIYPKKEFANLTKAQRDKVIELYRKRKDNTGQNASVSALSNLSSTISAAVVAGVRQASVTNLDDESITIEGGNDSNTIVTRSSNVSTGSGAIGDFMAKRRKSNNGSRAA